ncbi:MAG: hypothetical protein RJA77_412, partial [Pseudomonadota bacterium]
MAGFFNPRAHALVCVALVGLLSVSILVFLVCIRTLADDHQ